MSFIDHEEAKKYVRELLEYYGFLAKTERWSTDSKHRVDVWAECKNPELCGSHKVAVEVVRTSNLAKDAESLESFDADLKYVVLLGLWNIPQTFENIRVVKLKDFEETLRYDLGVDKYNPGYEKFRLPVTAAQPFSADLEEFRKKMKEMGVNWLLTQSEELLAKTYTVGEVIYQSCYKPSISSSEMICKDLEDQRVISMLENLGYLSRDAKGTLPERRNYIVRLTAKGELLSSQIIGSRITAEYDKIVNLVLKNRGVAILASIAGRSIAWNKRYARFHKVNEHSVDLACDPNLLMLGQEMELPNWLTCFGRTIIELPKVSEEIYRFWELFEGFTYKYPVLDSRGHMIDQYIHVPYKLIVIVEEESRARDYFGELYNVAQQLIALNIINILKVEDKLSLREMLSKWGLEIDALQKVVDDLREAGLTSKLSTTPPYLIVLEPAKLNEHIKSKLPVIDSELIEWISKIK